MALADRDKRSAFICVTGSRGFVDGVLVRSRVLCDIQASSFPMRLAKKPVTSLRAFLWAEGARRANSFRAAFSGLWRLIRTERHFQIHLVAAVCAITLAALLQFSQTDWIILILTIGLVLVAEGLNSAIERAIDTSAPGFNPLAKAAKDIGAGAVLIAAIVAVIVGLLLYVPRLWALAVGG